MSPMGGMLKQREDSSPQAAAGATSDKLIITLTPPLPALLARAEAPNLGQKFFTRTKYGADGSSQLRRQAEEAAKEFKFLSYCSSS